jgi:SAM-dependent methyltransferase
LSALNDPRLVRDEYASERGLLGRRAAYQFATGPNPADVAFEAVAAVAPTNVLEVGCGPGDFAARIRDELGSTIVAIDISKRMVELARATGVDAQVGDVQQLPFADARFDCAVAAWMLYHVPDVPRALEELARVLRPGGRLVAVTNRLDHLQEVRELIGAPPQTFTAFSGENAVELLGTRFATVEAVDARGEIRFPDRESVLEYLESTQTLWPRVEPVPDFELPFVVRRRPVVLIADKA